MGCSTLEEGLLLRARMSADCLCSSGACGCGLKFPVRAGRPHGLLPLEASPPCQNCGRRPLWAEAEGMVGRVFPKDEDLDRLPLATELENTLFPAQRPVG